MTEIRTGKPASRKSLKPDRLRAQPVLPSNATEDILQDADSPNLDNAVLEDTLRPSKSPAAKDLQSNPQSAGTLIVVSRNNANRQSAYVRSVAEELDLSTGEVSLASVAEIVSVPRLEEEVLAGVGEETQQLEAVDLNMKVNGESTENEVFSVQDRAVMIPTNEPAPGDSIIILVTGEVIPVLVPTVEHSAQSPARSRDSSTIPILVPDMSIDQLSELDGSDGSKGPIGFEGAGIKSVSLCSGENFTLNEGGKQEASETTDPKPIERQSISERVDAIIDCVPAESDPSQCESLVWSPRFSIGSPAVVVSADEDAGTSSPAAEGGNVQSEESTTDCLNFVQSTLGNTDTQNPPITQKHRHSIRLSMEDLTPEEITEAAISLHDYTGRKGSGQPGAELRIEVRRASNETAQSPSEIGALFQEQSEGISTKSAEESRGRTRSGTRFSDDATMLKDFLSRAQARKLAQTSDVPTSPPKTTSNARKSTRTALSQLDSNSPSPQKHQDIINRPGTPPGKGKLAAMDLDEMTEFMPEPASCRRSTRTRSPALSKIAAGVPSLIPVRRADGTDPVILQKSAAQELAIVTRANTRRNKGQAKIPKLALQTLPTEGLSMEVFRQRIKDGKTVGWDEKLAYFQDTTESIMEPNAERRPRVRRLRGLGAVNGTPAPKKMMADVNVSYGTPAPKRRGKIQW